MNTHDNIELPPMPEWAVYQNVENAVQAYAIAAVETDRKRRGEPSQQPIRTDWPEPLSEFKEGQWWVQELNNMKERQGITLDQERAVHVVHHLLASVALHLTQEKKNDY